jgi:hypothetical protein
MQPDPTHCGGGRAAWPEPKSLPSSLSQLHTSLAVGVSAVPVSV